MSPRFFVIVAALFFITVPGARAAMGISPMLIDLGEIGPGENRMGTFYIITDPRDEFSITLDVAEGSMDFWMDRDMRYNYSQQDVLSWVRFINRTVSFSAVEGSKSVRRKVNFIVSVPEDAEPGYHMVKLNPVRQVDTGGGGTTTIVSVIEPVVIFRVPGVAVRNGGILDINSESIGGRVRLNVFFLNNGTVSLIPKAEHITVYDDNGTVLGSAASSLLMVSPGEMGKLTGFLYSFPDDGEYTVTANVTYNTGTASFQKTFWIEEPEQAIPAPTAGKASEEAGFPWWFIALLGISAAAAYYLYKRD